MMHASQNFPQCFEDDKLYKLALEVVRLAAHQGMTLTTAESCTAGLVGATLTRVSGASEVYWGGVISYANEVKEQLLGVSSDILASDGAVSSACACAMAKGALKLTGVDLSVSVTGIAGPGGGSESKPVGTVWFALAERQKLNNSDEDLKLQSFLKHFKGEREEVRLQACFYALELMKSGLERSL